MHGKGGVHGRGACMVKAGMCGRGHVWQGVCMAEGHAWQEACVAGGACVASGGGIHGGVCVWQGACMVGRQHAWQGACMACLAEETATAADGTHPTGMHSCFSECHEENSRSICCYGAF